MIDIHSHVLWEVDDGASCLQQSLDMLEAAGRAGTTDIVATPHWNSKYEFQAEFTDSRIRQLTAEAVSGPRIHRGCEVHLTWDNVERLLSAPKEYTIAGKQYVLVEIPHQQVGKHIELVLEHLLGAGLSPIVAHPERNPVLQRKLERVEAWVELGCFTQLTALSITGGFGASARTASLQMLDRGLAHVVASDAHDPVHRHARLDEAYQAVRSRYGEECAEDLFTENPRAIVEGVRLPEGKRRITEAPGPWRRFWSAIS